MIESCYKRNLNHNYLTVKSEGSGHETYQARMLKANKIPGLLTCHLSYLNGQAEYSYDISSRQPLSVIYGEKEMGYEMVCRIVLALLHVLDKLEEFLLDGSSLVLDKDFIFVNVEAKSVWFCLVPHYYRAFPEAVHLLSTQLLDVINRRDERAVMLTYRLFRLSGESNFASKELKDLMENEDPGLNLESVRKTEFLSEKAGNGEQGAEQGNSVPVFISESIMEDTECVRWTDSPQNNNSNKEFGGGQSGGRETCQTGTPKKSGKPVKKFGVKRLLLIGFIILDLVLLGICGILFLENRNVTGKWGLTEGIRGLLFADMGTTLKVLGAGVLLLSIIAVKYLLKLQKRIIANRSPAGREAAGADFNGVNTGELARELEQRELVPEAFADKNGEYPAEADHFWDEEFMEQSFDKSAAYRNGDGGDGQFGDTVLLTEDMRMDLDAKARNSARSLSGLYKGSQVEFKIEETPFFIGKLKGSVNAVIQENAVSRIHAKIHEDEGRYYLTDLNSTNGTSINGQMLSAYQTVCIEPGDTLAFAGIALEFR